MMDFRCN